LERLLKSLANLEFKKTNAPYWQVVIVENDSEAHSKALIEELKKSFPVQIIYGIEPTPGIASARNKALSLIDQCDFFAFIDDDEISDPYWLDELLYVQKTTNADGVGGPVIPLFEITPPSWVIKGGFFNRPRRASGSEVKAIYTGNMLIKYEWKDKFEGPFDISKNLTGGEDSLFSLQMRELDAKLFWADEAVVKEYNTPDRLRVKWLVLRAFRGGSGFIINEKSINCSLYLRIYRFIISLVRIIIGIIIIIPIFIFEGYAGLIKALRMIAVGVGQLCGLLNINIKACERKESKTR